MKTMEIVFENCECFTIGGEIAFDVVDNDNAIDNIKIVIPRESNGVYYQFGGNQDTTKFNRFLISDDIAQIHIDGTCYYPKWYEENEYEWTQQNEYQHTYKTENGDLVIEISSANKQRQSDNEKIVELITDYMEEYPTMTFGQIVHRVECKIGSSVIDAKNGTVIEMLEELLMEVI